MSALAATAFAIGDWAWHVATEKACRVVDVQDVWGEATFRVWLPDDDRVVRARAGDLARLEDHAPSVADHIAYVAAAARVADAADRDVLLAPLEAAVIPLPHQVRALQRATAGDRVRFL